MAPRVWVNRAVEMRIDPPLPVGMSELYCEGSTTALDMEMIVAIRMMTKRDMVALLVFRLRFLKVSVQLCVQRLEPRLCMKGSWNPPAVHNSALKGSEYHYSRYIL